jgi:ribosomal protein S6--L-glutamate ligase
MLISSRGPLILEVNSSPGLEGIESSTGVNIAGEVTKYLDSIYQDITAEEDTGNIEAINKTKHETDVY